MMKIYLSDQEIELPAGSSVKALLKLVRERTGSSLPVGVKVNGALRDCGTVLSDGDQIEYLSFDDEAGKQIFWHSSAHILAQAVLRLYPTALPTIGPAIDEGFYYDFAGLSISDKDLEAIEAEMTTIIREGLSPERALFPSKQAAKEQFANNCYKCEIIDALPDGEEISAYRQGEFLDLCRGPHLPFLSAVKAVKLTKLAGAYWRANAQNEMLTRIYGITFPSKEQLKEHLRILEEAKKRDHKVLGPQLELFSLLEEAPGMPFIHPKGMYIWNRLIDFLRSELDAAGYIEIKTPSMMDKSLWERSGHWFHYRAHMYTSEIEDREFAIKPMNCPGCMLYYNTRIHSYRELPLRIAEIGHVHRHEHSGALSGLLRVRSFHQDDAHIFMLPEQLEGEILSALEFLDRLYNTFGLEYQLALSTRPPKDTIGTDEQWEYLTAALKSALQRWGRPYRVKEGDGAFYGPKIDISIRDALKRTWQCGTIQVDLALPERFSLEYTARDGSRQRPVMIHRAILGSIERFFGVLIEHFAGRFPLWISPVAVRILPVADRHLDTCHQVRAALKQTHLPCAIDDSDVSIGKKIRSAQLERVNYILVIGDKEAETGSVSVRLPTGEVKEGVPVDLFCERLQAEASARSLVPFIE